MKKTFTIEIDTTTLSHVTDEYLAGLWHQMQILPVDFGDREACEVVRAISYEIIKRWLRVQETPLYNVQPHDYLGKQLQRFASCNGSDWVARGANEETPS